MFERERLYLRALAESKPASPWLGTGRATRSGTHQFAAISGFIQKRDTGASSTKTSFSDSPSSYSQMTTRKLYVTAAQMARKLDCDKQTVMTVSAEGNLNRRPFLFGLEAA